MPDNKKYARYLANGEEIVTVFGIGNRYFWLNIASYLFLVTFLLIYPFILSRVSLLVAGYGWLIYLPAALVALIGLPFIIKLIHLRHKMAYIFTNRRVLIKDGVLSVKLTSAPYDKITHLTVKEDFLKRISYQMGDIVIHTAGPTPIETDLFKIQHPMKIKNLLEELIIKERSLLSDRES
ncbi:MAG: PH domain-containing protein [Patescibacteria group bacterium]|nr:PH domain-containing protein [Patescibacteria group bacterium]MCL5431821.1 PH domain-containing protein [Patescibacteria group bacterium]